MGHYLYDSQRKLPYLYDFYQIFTDNSCGYSQKFTDYLYFSLIFSVFLRFSPIFS